MIVLADIISVLTGVTVRVHIVWGIIADLEEISLGTLD